MIRTRSRRIVHLLLVTTLLAAAGFGAAAAARGLSGGTPAGADACDCVPGELIVRFEPTVTAEQLEQLQQQYGLEWRRLYAQAPYHWGIARVGEGQERFWMALLARLPFVRQVEPNAVRSIGASLALSGWSAPAPAASGNAPAVTADLAHRLRAFVRDRFTAAEARLIPLGSNLQRVEISGIKGEVIRQQSFWEKIVMHLVLEPVQPPRLHVMLEGWFAPGIGSRPPEQDAYRSMQPQYTESLREYLASTQAGIYEFLESEQTQ